MLPQLIGTNLFDMIAVDGDHSFNGGLIDLLITWELLAHGGWIVFDDINHPQHQYLTEVAKRFEECKPNIRESHWLPHPPHGPYGSVAWQKE